MQTSNTQQRQSQFYGAPIQQQFVQQLQNAKTETKRTSVKLTHDKKEQAFYLENVENAHHLVINAPGLKYKVTREIGGKNYKVQYLPKGEEHTVDVKYEGVHVDGSPFHLAPTPPKMVFNHDEKLFSVENVHDVEKLQINSDTLPYEMFHDKDSSTTYHVSYEPGQQIHDVDVVYDETPVEEGSFRLVPKEMKEAYKRDQEQETLTNKFGQLDMNAPGKLLWENNPESVNAQQNIGQFNEGQQVVMSNSEEKGDLIYEHIPQQKKENSATTLYQQPPHSSSGTFY